MENYTILLFLSTIIVIIFTYMILSKFFRKSKHLPPGPKPWPIIGNIHLLGDKPHRAVAELSKTFGPIMSLKLGSITTVVISSPEIAKEIYVKHDLAISSRSIPDVMRFSNHYDNSMITLPIGPKWLHLRKISTIQLFTNQRLEASQLTRQKKVQELVAHAQYCCDNGLPVDIGKAGFTTSLNLLSNTIFSMDLASHVSSSSQEFKDTIWQILEDSGKPNLSNFFPALRHFDLQGIMKRYKVNFSKMMRVFQTIMDERLRDPMAESKDDVLGTLLKLVKNNELTHAGVKHLLMDLFVAGTDTTSITWEWAMTELLRHPEKMKKAQSEIDEVVGKNGSVQESDISKLHYIQAIVKETWRLHPPGPFLLPHKADEDVQLCGYVVPKGAHIWVNVWATGRDPSVWPNPQSFIPERFLQSQIDVKGHDYELIPFGAGRRICPGLPLAHKMVHLMLTTLLHSFNWKCIDGISPKDIDLDENFGLTLQKAQPLQAIPLSK